MRTATAICLIIFGFSVIFATAKLAYDYRRKLREDKEFAKDLAEFEPLINSRKLEFVGMYPHYKAHKMCLFAGDVPRIMSKWATHHGVETIWAEQLAKWHRDSIIHGRSATDVLCCKVSKNKTTKLKQIKCRVFNVTPIVTGV